MPATPRMIYFDLGNVLLHFSHEQACRQMGEVAGVPTAAVRAAVFDSGLQWRLERGEIDSRKFCDAFCTATGAACDYAALQHAGSAIFEINGPVVAIVAQLRSAGRRLGVLSNTCEPHWRYVTTGRYQILPDYFDVAALSYELKAMKPDAACYRRAAELAGCEPAEIFFLDDRADNVAGAHAAGFDAVQYESPRQLAAALRERGVRFNY